MVIHRAFKNVRLMSSLEKVFNFLGLTKYFGSPIILRVEAK
jgi:hypothetical protein